MPIEGADIRPEPLASALTQNEDLLATANQMLGQGERAIASCPVSVEQATRLVNTQAASGELQAAVTQVDALATAGPSAQPDRHKQQAKPVRQRSGRVFI
ncbi:hypothetical protein [Photobacterium sp. J15]|uniref:hypothetical protein n=1 Tax=Photobacterium sp. J15 TaxID=265901 RepID=UPI0007E2EF7D|nr:hypothetical protein [Photobacterium sp. J15]